MLVAPVVLQLSVLLAPAPTPEGAAAKELTIGRLGFVGSGALVTPAQLARLISVASTAKRKACAIFGCRGDPLGVAGTNLPAKPSRECRLENLRSLIRKRLARFLIARVSIRKPGLVNRDKRLLTWDHTHAQAELVADRRTGTVAGLPFGHCPAASPCFVSCRINPK
jgi:hypothetical protein